MDRQKRFTEECMVCGQKLEYLAEPEMLRCIYCGTSELGYFKCTGGHYVCNSCHADTALVRITQYCLGSASKDPLEMLEELMRDPEINMHGPEHHALVPAVLVAAFRNCKGELEQEAILEGIRRGASIPGGYCGLFGACGAGIGAGVAVSVITGSTPLKAEQRALSNLMTAQALQAIGQEGGVRCCKACSRTAVLKAVEFISQNLDCSFEQGKPPVCAFMQRNKQCNLKGCLYFPK